MINKQTVLRILEDRKARLTDSLIDDALEVELDVLINKISNLPEEDEWIPCSERLPKIQDSRNTILKMYLVQGRFDRIYKGFRDENGVWKNEHGNMIKPVIAWMPLPEPYQKE